MTCELRTLSEFLRSTDRAVDLLKIDAEQSEQQILAGLAEEDWPKIRQIVVEVHEGTRRPGLVESLRRRGFRTAVEPNPTFPSLSLVSASGRTVRIGSDPPPRPATSSVPSRRRGAPGSCRGDEPPRTRGRDRGHPSRSPGIPGPTHRPPGPRYERGRAGINEDLSSFHSTRPALHDQIMRLRAVDNVTNLAFLAGEYLCLAAVMGGAITFCEHGGPGGWPGLGRPRVAWPWC